MRVAQAQALEAEARLCLTISHYHSVLSVLDNVLFGHSSFSLLIKKQWRWLSLFAAVGVVVAESGN